MAARHTRRERHTGQHTRMRVPMDAIASTNTENTAPSTALTRLAAQVRTVHYHRGAAEALQALLAKDRLAWNADHADMIRDCTDATARQLEAEQELRALTLSYYQNDPAKNTKPTPGVEIKIRKGLDYNPDAAFLWAKDKGMALTQESLDVKAFEKICTATDIPFVVRTSHPSPTISTDLGKAIGATE